MIKLLIGQTGIGKTKDIIQDANDALATAKGNIIFVDESDEGILELHHDIRYINISKFPINSSNEFIAFLYGLMGSNYDIEKIYLDGILNLYIMTDFEICAWLEKVEEISKEHEVEFEITLSYNKEIPECFNRFL